MYVQAIQSGTIAFVQQLRKRKCDDSSEALLLLSGHELTTEYLQKHGFNKPVLVECKDGLEIVVPASTFTVADVEKHVGKYYMKNMMARLLHSNDSQKPHNPLSPIDTYTHHKIECQSQLHIYASKSKARTLVALSAFKAFLVVLCLLFGCFAIYSLGAVGFCCVLQSCCLSQPLRMTETRDEYILYKMIRCQ